MVQALAAVKSGDVRKKATGHNHVPKTKSSLQYSLKNSSEITNKALDLEANHSDCLPQKIILQKSYKNYYYITYITFLILKISHMNRDLQKQNYGHSRTDG